MVNLFFCAPVSHIPCPLAGVAMQITGLDNINSFSQKMSGKMIVGLAGWLGQYDLNCF
jgi:hypothetical protein